MKPAIVISTLTGMTIEIHQARSPSPALRRSGVSRDEAFPVMPHRG
jgi:hypothetical protein